MSVAEIISWIILGALAGYIASVITNTSEGMVGNIVVGIIGAFLGGLLLRIFGVSTATGGFSLTSLVTAILGAVVLLGLIRGFRRSRI